MTLFLSDHTTRVLVCLFIQWNYHPPSVLSGDQERLVPVKNTPSEWSHQCYGFWYDLAGAGRPSLKSGAAVCGNVEWERSTGRMFSNWNTWQGSLSCCTTLASGSNLAPKAAASFSLCVGCCFSSSALHGARSAGTLTSYFEAGCLYGTGDPLSQSPQCWEYRWVPSS